MNRLLRCSVTALAALTLTGCAFLEDAVWPSLSGDPGPAQETPSAYTDGEAIDLPLTDAERSARIETARATMDDVSEALRTLAARIPFHSDLFDRRRSTLGEQAAKLSDLAARPGEDRADRWSRLQAELARLGQDLDGLSDERGDVAADAALGAGLLADLRTVDPVDLPPDDVQRRSLLVNDLEAILAALGQMDRSMGEAQTRWNNFLAAQDSQIAALEPPPLNAAPEPAPAPRPAARPQEPQVTPPGPVPPQDSGDRFKGRQPLVTLNFADPDLEFENQLRSLVDRVRAQYPDIAFDVETVAAPPGQLGALVTLLRELGVPADVYSTPADEFADPIIRLYPR
ncbi:MAG: hypothetical protein ACE363_14945 [Alphaproteobacteria bacterium]